jgi:diguanylate cyclase (GGDEF)-like protein
VVRLPSNARQDASGFGEKLRRNIEHLGIAHEGSPVGVVTISVGAASTQPRQGDSFLQLVDAADVALYEAKRSGKNRVVAREGANVAVMAASRGSAA